jgi:predicted small metal-binding protein
VEVEGKDPAEEVEKIVVIHDTTSHDNFLIGDNVGKPDSETLNYKPIDEVETITQIISDVISDITDEVKDGKPEV